MMDQIALRYFIVHKPYGTSSQFVSPDPGPLLGDLSFPFPEGTHAIGRLDKPSEGLLLLTTDKRITALLFQSGVPHSRTYCVEVQPVLTDAEIDELRTGVTIRTGLESYYRTPACDVRRITAPSIPSPRQWPPYVPTSWISITLQEGKFRQIRKMITAVRHKVVRLIRVSIEDILLSDLAAGEVREIDRERFFRLLRITEPATTGRG